MGNVDIGKAFGEGWNMFKENMGVCILSVLVAGIVSGVTFGICAGPLTCGVYMILRRLAKKSEPKPTVGDVFKGFDLFLQAFLLLFICGIVYCVAQVVLMLIPVVGWLVLMLLCFVYGPVITWSLMLVANRGMKWNEAVGLVLKSTFGGKFTMPIVLGIVAGFVGGLGVILCGIGLIFTLPFSLCVYAAAYEQVFGDESAAAPVEAEVVS